KRHLVLPAAATCVVLRAALGGSGDRYARGSVGDTWRFRRPLRASACGRHLAVASPAISTTAAAPAPPRPPRRHPPRPRPCEPPTGVPRRRVPAAAPPRRPARPCGRLPPVRADQRPHPFGLLSGPVAGLSQRA